MKCERPELLIYSKVRSTSLMIFSFGLFMLLYAASKNPNLPSEWTGIHKVESGIQIPKSSSECGSD